MSSKNRRKMSGFVIDASALVRLSIPFFLLIVIAVGTLLSIHWSISRMLMETQVDASANTATVAALLNVLSKVTTIGMIGLGLLGTVCLVLWIIFSHRIFGPMVPIRRHVGQLLEGNFESRVTLRSMDEFKELAADLNQLAEKLSAKPRA